MTQVKVALLQLNSGPDIAANLAGIENDLRQAKAGGAELVVLPENCSSMAYAKEQKLKNAFAENDHPAHLLFARLCRELGLWLVAGSLSIKQHGEKISNRCLVYNALGAVVGRYDKIHLFDAEPKAGESYRESELVQPGDKAVLVTTPWAKLGLSICYDVRFPQLYRALAQAGASLLTVPAAFTVPTGQAHWHVLLRARAIETGCFVLAPAQAGTHDGGRKTYGHSLIISPWGEILAEANSAGAEIITATLDLDRVAAARNAIGALGHDRIFTGP